MYNAQGVHEIILVCEHASAFIPEQYQNLGLDNNAAQSHAAWDPGAANTAHYLADRLNAVLVESTISRLVYDCNRPPESATAMPAKSEIFTIPGNRNLSDEQKQYRIENYYNPFKAQLARSIEQHPVAAVLVTVHSFTPVYNGIKRPVEIGFLHDQNSQLAETMLDVASGYNIQLNQPYGIADGVTHTLKLHGVENGLHNVMIEIRNDLIQSDSQCRQMAEHLELWLTQSLPKLETQPRLTVE
ncbi:N-formylglutamate amidohydrolase [Chromatiales bacterium (ex Bugula neritina AB1)]|nr:N-formylglutamate amidohydrolase [Chromatiales bacterium (ex Bugula neritina AB1)]